MILINGRVWTGNHAQPSAEAIATDGDRIVSVGSTADVRQLARHAATIDLAGAFVVPGFVDAHVHFVDGGFRLTSVQLRDAACREEFVARIRAFADTVLAGTWIIGGDWITRYGAASCRGVTGLMRSRRIILCGSTGSTSR